MVGLNWPLHCNLLSSIVLPIYFNPSASNEVWYLTYKTVLVVTWHNKLVAQVTES